MCGERVDKKALSIRCDRVLKQYVAGGNYARLEERVGHADDQLTARGIHGDRHQLLIKADEENLLAIRSPTWL